MNDIHANFLLQSIWSDIILKHRFNPILQTSPFLQYYSCSDKMGFQIVKVKGTALR